MKFSMRDLLWLTLVVALIARWWADKSRSTSREEHWRQQAADLEKELQTAGEYIVVGTRRFPLKSPMP